MNLPVILSSMNWTLNYDVKHKYPSMCCKQHRNRTALMIPLYVSSVLCLSLSVFVCGWNRLDECFVMFCSWANSVFFVFCVFVILILKNSFFKNILVVSLEWLWMFCQHFEVLPILMNIADRQEKRQTDRNTDRHA